MLFKLKMRFNDGNKVILKIWYIVFLYIKWFLSEVRKLYVNNC